jgi:hypothetical protein
MDKKNFFTVNTKEKGLEETNEVAEMCVSESGLLLAMDRHGNGRIYSVYHGNKVYKVLSSGGEGVDADEKMGKVGFKREPRY